MKPLLCVDFDGVLHSYTSGWKGATVVSDPPVPGAMAFLREAVKRFKVCIYSSRSHELGGIEAMREWILFWASQEEGRLDENMAWFGLLEFPTRKPPALVTIDDRAVQFTGTFPSIDFLLNFQPWNKK